MELNALLAQPVALPSLPRAVALLKRAGYENVHSLAGGLAAWRESNLPVEKSAA